MSTPQPMIPSPRRSRRAWLGPAVIVPAVVAVFAALGAALPVQRPAVGPPRIATPVQVTGRQITTSVDRPRVKPVQGCVAEDDSGSEFGPKGTDPTGLRYAAAGQLLRYLEGMTLPEGRHELSLVRFGSDARVAVPRTVLTDSGSALVRSALKPGAPLGATNFPAVLAACGQQLAGAANPVIVVVSDGDPDLQDGRSQDALFADIARSIRALRGIPVHVLLIARSGVPAASIARWRAAGVASVVDLGDPSELEQRTSHELISVLASRIGVLPRPLGVLDADRPVLRFDVPAYSPSMSVTAFAPRGNATVLLRGPDGKLAGRGSAGVAVLDVTRPASGRWSVELSGAGTVEVQADITPLQAHLVSPEGAVPVGRPLQVAAAVGRGTIELRADAPLYVGAVVSANGRSYELQLRRDAGGTWRSVEAAPVTAAGPVSIRLVLKAGSDTVLDATTATMDSVAAPYLVADSPTVVDAPGAVYGWRLFRGGRPVGPDVLGEDPRAAVTVALGDGRVRRADYAGGGRWTVPAGALRDAPVQAWLSSRLQDGTAVRDTVTTRPLVVTPVTEERLLRAAVAAAAAGLLLLAGWLAWLFAVTRRRVEGHLRDPLAAGGRPIRVRSRRWFRPLGRRCVVWRTDERLYERRGLLPWPLDAQPSAFTLSSPRSATTPR